MKNANEFMILLKKDGTLWGSGMNNYGQLGLGDVNSRENFTQIGQDDDWSKFEYLEKGVVALKKNGTLWFFGRDFYKIAGNVANKNYLVPVQIGSDDDWGDFSTGYYHIIAQKKDKSIWGKGLNSSGELGLGHKNEVLEFEKNDFLSSLDVQQISCGFKHSLALTIDGDVYTWGFNQWGQLGDNSFTHKDQPYQIPDIKGNKVLAASESSFIIDTNEDLYGSGYNYSAHMGVSSPDRFRVFTKLQSNIKDVYSTGASSAIIISKQDDNYIVSSSGNNGNSVFGTSTYFRQRHIFNQPINDILILESGACFLLEDGTLIMHGKNELGRFGSVSSVGASVNMLEVPNLKEELNALVSFSGVFYLSKHFISKDNKLFYVEGNELKNKAFNISDIHLNSPYAISNTQIELLEEEIDKLGDVEVYTAYEKKAESIDYILNTKDFSVYDYISEQPEIIIVNEYEEDEIVITTTTELFTIYDEFGDEVEVLYYTDDPDVTAADLIIEANWSPLDELEGPKEVVVWTDEKNAQRELSVEGLFKEEFVHLNYWINIENLISVNIAGAGDPAPFVLQRKDNQKYYSYYQGHFFEIPLNERMVHNYGFTPNEINAITTQEWLDFLGDETEIRFCYLFSNQSIATQSVSASLDTVHTIGTIKILRQIRENTPTVSKVEARIEKFSLEGRLKEIERINVNNLLALQSRTALIFGVSKMNMHEMVVETFDDADYEVLLPDAEGSMYNPTSKRFEGNFKLEVPLDISTYAENLYIQTEGESLAIMITDDVHTHSIANENVDTINVALFDKTKTKMVIESHSEDGWVQAIAYAWQ